MSKTKNEINIARIIYDAYPHSDLLPIDPEQDCCNLQTLLTKVTNENIGDGLFKFIVVEIVEGGEGALKGAIKVMERAKKDVETVLLVLWKARMMQISSHTISDMPDKLSKNKIAGVAADLFEACNVLTSYTMDLLRRLDNQVDMDDIEEIQQAKDVIAKYTRVIADKS